MTARTCPVHGEYSESGICRWCEANETEGLDATNGRMSPRIPNEPVSLPGLKGLWQKPDRVEVNEAGVPTYTWSFEEETPDAYVFRLEWTKAASEAIAAGVSKACEARLATEHAALRWERVARRWAAKLPFRCACRETALAHIGDARMFRQDARKWKRHTTKRCVGDLVNPMCQCGEWLFDAVLFRGLGEPFEQYAAGRFHSPERCTPPKEPTP